MGLLKHSARACIVCRDYKFHHEAKPPLGNWVARLGTIHWKRNRSDRRMACGLRHRLATAERMGDVWTLMAGEATCRVCRRAAAAERLPSRRPPRRTGPRRAPRR